MWKVLHCQNVSFLRYQVTQETQDSINTLSTLSLGLDLTFRNKVQLLTSEGCFSPLLCYWQHKIEARDDYFTLPDTSGNTGHLQHRQQVAYVLGKFCFVEFKTKP